MQHESVDVFGNILGLRVELEGTELMLKAAPDGFDA
jgi:hypothetical protein